MRLKNFCKVLGVVAALTLVGCGGQNAEESKAPEETTKAESKGDASAINVYAAAS